jgi:hypothetical protein
LTANAASPRERIVVDRPPARVGAESIVGSPSRRRARSIAWAETAARRDEAC